MFNILHLFSFLSSSGHSFVAAPFAKTILLLPLNQFSIPCYWFISPTDTDPKILVMELNSLFLVVSMWEWECIKRTIFDCRASIVLCRKILLFKYKKITVLPCTINLPSPFCTPVKSKQISTQKKLCREGLDFFFIIFHIKLSRYIFPLHFLQVDNIEDCFSIIKSRPKPLAAYLFTNNEQLKKDYVEKISSGGMLINDTVVHVVIILFLKFIHGNFVEF